MTNLDALMHRLDVAHKHGQNPAHMMRTLYSEAHAAIEQLRAKAEAFDLIEERGVNVMTLRWGSEDAAWRTWLPMWKHSVVNHHDLASAIKKAAQGREQSND